MTGIGQKTHKACHRSEQFMADRSTSQQSVSFVLSKTDPEHHDLEARSDAMITIES